MGSAGILDKMRARADQFFRNRQFDQAAAAYREILQIVPSDFDAIHHLGVIAVQLSHMEEGRKLLNAAVGVDGSKPEVWLHLGMALQHLGRVLQAGPGVPLDRSR